MSFTENLDWRYATKEFDDKKLSDDVVKKIVTAIRMCPSSFGIQPYHITIVRNEELKAKLNDRAFWDQKQIKTCSHLFVFSADTDIDKRSGDFVTLAFREGRTDISDDPEYDYRKGAVEFADKIGPEWAAKQAYIALGFALAACAELKVDSCPMEAADLASIKEILQLSSNLDPKVLLAIGYRSQNDKHASEKKIRFDEKDLVDFI